MHQQNPNVPAPDPYAPRARRVLVADDDLEMRQVVCEILEDHGFVVVEASSGVALLAHLADGGEFDLVVTDVRMPWISGQHVVEMARAAGYRMPVLIMTAYVDEALHRAVAALPDTALLEKPFEMRELVDRARQMLQVS